ncbi:uncharacterized protein LOC130014270 [Patella vulgata]|uniref:uncharacterized protein LOC130014270 n=1 Tax=Patella vulgata TaxID=6465 RepID=UPI0024A96E07|nr:uncharacterized protein LOC130014270 [Patella vulgata]
MFYYIYIFIVTTGTEGTSPTVVCAEVKGMEDPAIIPTSSITAPGVSNPENLRPGTATTATFPAQTSPISVTIDLAPITDETVEIKSVELVSPQNVGSIRVFVIATGGSETEATYLTAVSINTLAIKTLFLKSFLFTRTDVFYYFYRLIYQHPFLKLPSLLVRKLHKSESK